MAQTSALYSGSTTATRKPWRKATAWFCCWYRSVLASSVGGAYSSGIRNSLLRRAAKPRPVRLVITATGADRISDTTIGASHQRKAASSQATSAVQSTPMTICEPCRRRASPQGVALSPRCGEFHCTDQPRKAAVTNTLWKSMRTGASSTENKVSISIDSSTRSRPP